MRLAGLDASTRDDAIAFHGALLDDADERVEVRCYAAYQLVQLDRTYWPTAVATLRLLSASTLATPANQEDTIIRLLNLKHCELVKPPDRPSPSRTIPPRAPSNAGG
ncbi:MAG: hypothetical protein ACRDSL_16410 [Pseudonocardiaceae bacterium]